MTLERITEIPRPLGITDVKGVVNYLGNLATTLQDHMSMRPEDLQNLVDGFAYSSTTHATTHSNGGTDAVNHDNLAGFVANEHLLPASIDHDALLNFTADKHVAHSGVSISAGGLLTGGGTIAANRTITLVSSSVDHDACANFVANEHLPGIDEDNMVSDSAVHVPTQQSVKAYVDTEVSKAMYTTSVLKVYPNSAAPIAAVSSATAWAFGAYVEVVPVNTITSAFIVIGVKITRDLAATGEWQIRIASGAAASEVVKMNFAGDSEDDTNAGSVVATPIPVLFSANDRISVGVSDEEAAARNYRVKILYYELPL